MITVSISIFIKEEQIDFAKNLMTSFKPKALDEVGCLSYELFQAKNKSGLFLFFEKWKTVEDSKTHCNQPYIREFEQHFDKIQLRPNEVSHYESIE